MTNQRNLAPKVYKINELPFPRVESSSSGKLHSIEINGSGVVRLTLIFRGGSSIQRSPFSASSTLSMLSEGGAGAMSGEELSELLDFYGIYFDSSTDRDYSTITVACLTKFLSQTLDFLTDILLAPRFDPLRFEVYRAAKFQRTAIERSKPRYIANEAFAKNLFGAEHPYGRFFPTESINKLEVNDLRDYYSNCLINNFDFAVCSGEVGGDAGRRIESFLTQFDNQSTSPFSLLMPDAPLSKTNTEVIERNEAGQSSIRMGRLICDKRSEDYVGMQLLTTILGGYFSSRLMQSLREEHGLTYGIGAQIVPLRWSTYLAISSEVKLGSDTEAIDLINRELELLCKVLVDPLELEMAKNTITGEVLRLLDGPFGVADIAIENIQSGFAPNYLSDFLSKIESLTPVDLLRLANNYLTANSFTTIIVK